MIRTFRHILLRLMLVIGLALAPFSASTGAEGLAMGVAALSDAAHHGPQDPADGQPPCALVRCECHACPHLLAPIPSAERARDDARGIWGDRTDRKDGIEPKIEPPPPRSTNVETT